MLLVLVLVLVLPLLVGLVVLLLAGQDANDAGTAVNGRHGRLGRSRLYPGGKVLSRLLQMGHGVVCPLLQPIEMVCLLLGLGCVPHSLPFQQKDLAICGLALLLQLTLQLLLV